MAAQSPDSHGAFATLRGSVAQPLHVLNFPHAWIRLEMVAEVTGMTGPEARRLLPAPIRINGKDRWPAHVVVAMLRSLAAAQ